jgi:erythritol kinase
MADERYLLGIDAGTSVIKAVLFDVHGGEIIVVRRDSQVERPQPDWSETDMEAVWQVTREAIRAVTAQVPGERIAGVGITGTCCGAWLLDADGRPVRRAVLWNDGRASDLLAEWQRESLTSRIFSISGNALFPGYTLAVLAWLRRHEPATLTRAKWLLFSKDWIRYQLTGEIATEESDCSYLPYDIGRRAISQELFDLAGVGEYSGLVPKILSGYEIAGQVRPEAAAATGLRQGTPVVAGLVDVVASTLGAGAWRPGQACTIIGTSALNSLVSRLPMFEPADVGVQAVMPDGNCLRSLVNTSGTLNINWMLDVLAGEETARAQEEDVSVYALVEEKIRAVPLGSEGVMYHPYINTAGVISPFVNPTARAQFFGIGLGHTRSHLMRAVYEGVALAILDAYENMPERCDEVLLSGGGARSEFWSQMLADATGRRVAVAGGSEFGARGAAMMAGVGAGVYRNLEQAVSIAQVVRQHEPDPQAHRLYREWYRLYREIYQRLNDAWWMRHRILQGLQPA